MIEVFSGDIVKVRKIPNEAENDLYFLKDKLLTRGFFWLNWWIN